MVQRSAEHAVHMQCELHCSVNSWRHKAGFSPPPQGRGQEARSWSQLLQVPHLAVPVCLPCHSPNTFHTGQKTLEGFSAKV